MRKQEIVEAIAAQSESRLMTAPLLGASRARENESGKTMSPGAGTPTGSVSFVHSPTNTSLGSIVLDSAGVAALTTNALPEGLAIRYHSKRSFATAGELLPGARSPWP